jgi:penicillin amidase
MKFVLRWLARGALVLLALPLLLAGWIAFALVSTQPQTQGERRVSGLDGAVRIVRDEQGVPHIFAASPSDAYFALGYAHAQDRFFQMDMTRRAAQGRLAEVVGDLALRADAQTRIKGLHLASAAQAKRLTPETRAILQAYADGVNARLRSGGASAEHRMLAMRVEPWRVEDSVAVAVALSDLLTSGEQFEVAEARLSKRLSEAQLKSFFPDYPAWARNVVGGVSAATAITAAEPASPGSNAWALAGSRTTSGKPLLAADPHLGFEAPAHFYLANLRLRDGARTGFTIPGAPFLVFGHNGAIAWAVTNNELDAADIAAPVEHEALKERTETIRVRSLFGAPRVVRIDVKANATAALLDPRYFNLTAFGDQTLVYRDLAMDPDNDVVNALAAMNAARSMDEFAAALQGWRAPLVHITAASRSGEIAIFEVGDPPLRAMDGRWIARRSTTSRMNVRNPEGGALAAANNLWHPDVTMQGAFDPYRVTRIHDLLDAGASADIDSAVIMQMDTVSPFARRVLPTMLRAAPTSREAREALGLLRAWDGDMAGDRAEPLIFAAWIEALSQAIYEDDLGETLFPAYAGPRSRFLESVLEGDDAVWCDRRKSEKVERCADLLAPSLEAALARLRQAQGVDMSRWRWSRAHNAHFRHPLMTAAPLLNTLYDARVSIGGSADTIAVGAYWHGNGFTAVHGPSARAVFDLSDLDRSRFVLAPGQSAHPLSRHYRDLVARWASNRGFELRGDWDASAPPDGARALKLKPAKR